MKLPIFLERNFSCTFKRMFPEGSAVRKGGKIRRHQPDRNPRWDGATGNSFLDQIEVRLPHYIKTIPPLCNLVLFFDDLDCRPVDTATSQITQRLHKINEKPDFTHRFVKYVAGETLTENEIPYIIAFAAPEIESWILADWDKTIGKSSDFGQYSDALKYALAEHGVSFKKPEQFSQLNEQGNSCKDKLSETIIDAVDEIVVGKRYRKGEDTPDFLVELNAETVQAKCDLFRLRLYRPLATFCKPNYENVEG